jgi:hypothetical protein
MTMLLSVELHICGGHEEQSGLCSESFLEGFLILSSSYFGSLFMSLDSELMVNARMSSDHPLTSNDMLCMLISFFVVQLDYQNGLVTGYRIREFNMVVKDE